MVNLDLIAAKLADLGLRMDRLKKHGKARAEELSADPDALDLVSFNLMLAVQICADIASHIIADQAWRNARTLAESFERLHEHGVVSRSSATALSRAAGLRNVIAHGYTTVDVQSVHAGATSGIRDLDGFAREVAAWVARQP